MDDNCDGSLFVGILCLFNLIVFPLMAYLSDNALALHRCPFLPVSADQPHNGPSYGLYIRYSDSKEAVNTCVPTK